MLFPATSLTRRRRVRIERDRAHTIDHIALSNGIRAHVRSMRDGRDRVHLVLTLPGGRICEGERQLGLTSAAALLFTRPATRGAATHEIRDYLADKEITLECEVDEDALRLDLSADRADFEDGLRLLQALLTEPRLGEDALALWRERLRVMHSAPHLPIDRVLATAALSLLTGNDPRFRLITARRAASIARRAAEAWLGRLIARAPIEIGLCGDITLAAARRLIERHFSGLPRRAASTAAFSHLRRLDIRNGPLEIEKHAALARGQAAFLLGWRAVPWQAMTERRLLQMACEILNARLHAEIRERQGLTYEIGAHYSPSRAYPQASLLSISCLIAPRTLAHALRDVRRLVEQFAALGPRETETRAVARHYAALTERARGEPRHWARMLAEIETRGLDLDDILHLPQFLRSVKAEDLRRTFAAVAVDANRLQVICRPR
jgi:predicted Zn-dependent peptidase